MKKFKRSIAMLLTVVVAISMLAGCSSTTTSSTTSGSSASVSKSVTVGVQDTLANIDPWSAFSGARIATLPLLYQCLFD